MHKLGHVAFQSHAFAPKIAIWNILLNAPRVTMKIFVWLFRLLILLLLVWFSVKNSSQMVTLYAYPYSWQAPLVLIILAFFAGGVMLGLLASLGSIYRHKRDIAALRKDLKARQDEFDKAALSVAPTAPTSQSSGIGNHGV